MNYDCQYIIQLQQDGSLENNCRNLYNKHPNNSVWLQPGPNGLILKSGSSAAQQAVAERSKSLRRCPCRKN
jgi:hypothetical protein